MWVCPETCSSSSRTFSCSSALTFDDALDLVGHRVQKDVDVLVQIAPHGAPEFLSPNVERRDLHLSLPSAAPRTTSSTARMRVPRAPWSSSAARPAMVVPPGEATRSFNAAGDSPTSSISSALPKQRLSRERARALSRQTGLDGTLFYTLRAPP